MKRMNTTALTEAHMQAQGYTTERVEHHARHGGRTNDLFGFIDVLCLGDGVVVGVQTTSDSGGNMSARIKKIADHPNVSAVRKAGIRILVQGWKLGKDGKYVCREVDCS